MPLMFQGESGNDTLMAEDIIELASSFSDELFRIIPEVVYFGFYSRSGNLLFSRKRDPNIKSIVENPLTRLTLIAIIGGIEKLGNALSQKVDKVILRTENYRMYLVFIKEAFRALIISHKETPEGIIDYALSEFNRRIEKIL